MLDICSCSANEREQLNLLSQPFCHTTSSTFHVSWQDMASGAKESTGESGSAARAGPLKAAAHSECPICLGAVRKPAYVAYCMHQFCFRCIRHWAQGREDCPVCRQALEQVLHSVRGDDDYELFVVGLPARLRRRMAMDRARSRFPQRRYDLRDRKSVV